MIIKNCFEIKSNIKSAFLKTTKHKRKMSFLVTFSGILLLLSYHEHVNATFW